ncbi:anaerobic sulfatase maturase, partial [Vibrio parahaemolyticus]|nr:anaerobic sulfatase maturase [Vibrio parahaemolyticus]
AKSRTLPQQCLQCDYQFACFGECPKNRFIRTRQGEPGLNYLCAGWKKFFTHVDQSMAYILRATGNPVVHGKYSDQILRQQATQTQTVFETKF